MDEGGRAMMRVPGGYGWYNFKSLDVDFEGAGMVTNGYLLDSKKIARLNDLKINSTLVDSFKSRYEGFYASVLYAFFASIMEDIIAEDVSNKDSDQGALAGVK